MVLIIYHIHINTLMGGKQKYIYIYMVNIWFHISTLWTLQWSHWGNVNTNYYNVFWFPHFSNLNLTFLTRTYYIVCCTQSTKPATLVMGLAVRQSGFWVFKSFANFQDLLILFEFTVQYIWMTVVFLLLFLFEIYCKWPRGVENLNFGWYALLTPTQNRGGR